MYAPAFSFNTAAFSYRLILFAMKDVCVFCFSTQAGLDGHIYKSHRDLEQSSGTQKFHATRFPWFGEMGCTACLFANSVCINLIVGSFSNSVLIAGAVSVSGLP